MENNGSYVGINIGNKITQIAVYNEELFKPVCVGDFTDENKNFIMTEDNLDDRDNLASFIGKCLSVAKKNIEGFSVSGLVVTIRNADKEHAEIFKEIISSFGIDKNKIEVQNYKQSYMYYVMNQSREFWINDVGMFDFSEDGLRYYQMTVDRRRLPYIAGVIEKDYTGNSPYGKDRTFMFENIVENALHKQIISTIYMTGEGFNTDWADDSMRELSRGRRIFKGQNLFVEGACYAARNAAGLGIMPECIFIDDEMIRVHISTTVYVKAETQDILLAKAGTKWYEADSSIYVIPDKENEILLNVTNVITREHSKYIIPLDFICEDRENMTTRLRVRIRFQDVNRAIVTIKDEGFGTMYKSSGRIYEKILQV